MNISIDLLPQRVIKKEKGLPIIPVVGAFTVIAAASFLTYTYFETKNSVQSLEQQVVAQTAELHQLEQDFITKTTGITEYNYVDYYTSMNTFLGGIYKDTVDLKEQMYMLLPDKAEVTNYSFINNGDLSMQVTFQSKGDAAVYLNRLINSNLVSNAQVESISTSDDDFLYQSQYTLKLNTLVGEGS
ncbi:PilN domain-containing protein [Alkalihalobacterium elongatum]|uniref:PilN domain-containing protein n=1 Tax=Alkalihalobacterium elongatum TaxID=2675466 RepID=UPI001C2004A3|nr:PilN domain-containing protein [Alkalihalobacterium elongatum]